MKALIDTNILIYAVDQSDKRKHAIAKELVKKVFSTDAVISTQNIGEFFFRCKRNLSKEELEVAKLLAVAVLQSKNWKKISYSQDTMAKVIASDRSQFDFWDSVLYFTMLENGIKEIITENEADFSQFGGIKITNPFKG